MIDGWTIIRFFILVDSILTGPILFFNSDKLKFDNIQHTTYKYNKLKECKPFQVKLTWI